MKNKMITVGLDIGTTKVVVIVGEKLSDGTLRILGLGQSVSTGVDKGAIQNINKTIAAIREAVDMAEKSSGYKINKVTVGIAGQYIRSTRQVEYIVRSNSNDVIQQSDIDALTAKAAALPVADTENILHILPQEYKVDSQDGVLEPIGMAGKRLEATFHMVIGQTAPLQNVKRCVEGAGLSLAGVCLQPMASSDSVLSQDEKEAGVVMVDIGGGTSDLVIVRDMLVRHSAVLSAGGNIITEDIISACSILKRYAELLKKEYGSTWPGENSDTDVVSIPVMQGYPSQEISLKDLSKVIYARMDEIMDNINNEILNYRQMEPGRNLIGGIVITGGGSLLRHLTHFVHYKTGMNCRIGIPDVYVADAGGYNISNPIYATCVGLVLSANDDNYVECIEEKSAPEPILTDSEKERVKDMESVISSIGDDEGKEQIEEYVAAVRSQNPPQETEKKEEAVEEAPVVVQSVMSSQAKVSIPVIEQSAEKAKKPSKMNAVGTRINTAIMSWLEKLGD